MNKHLYVMFYQILTTYINDTYKLTKENLGNKYFKIWKITF